ncbi:MAG: DNA alkylation repair protein [Microthrixaceae bacterium]
MPKDSRENAGAFKHLLDPDAVRRMGDAFAVESASFDREQFVALAGDGIEDLELKARVAQVAGALQVCLPSDFGSAVAAVDRLVGADGMAGLFMWPVTDWVTRAGRDAPAQALELLARLTPYSTGEFAVRPFIDDDPAGVLARFGEWIGRDDEHVRRLVSEGTRPRLPWAPRLAVAEADPGYAVHLLDRLVDDSSEFVRRSVSNHLNDLNKMDVGLALDVAGRWAAKGATAAAAGDIETARRIDRVIRHGLRTLVKAGDPDTMRLLGHDPDVPVEVEEFRVTTPVVTVGEHAELALTLRSLDDVDHRVVLDYAVHLRLANGSTGRKVFKWSAMDLAAGEQRRLSKRHSMKPVTIRTYRPGTHLVEVQLNGRVVASDSFELQVP